MTKSPENPRSPLFALKSISKSDRASVRVNGEKEREKRRGRRI
jgi:hypothetical protein